MGDGLLDIGSDTNLDDAVAAVRAWVDEHVPVTWREAADRGGATAIREVRSRREYEDWYPVFGRSGLVVPTWPVAYGGLDLSPATARADRRGAPALQPRPAQSTRPQPRGARAVRLRHRGATPPVLAAARAQRGGVVPAVQRARCRVRSRVAGDRVERDGDDWVVTGQKVWTTWAHLSDYAVLLGRTDVDASKRDGLTYFLIDLRQPGVEIKPLRHIGGEIDFNEVFLDGARVPDDQRVGDVGDGWRVANATLSGERQMVSGAGSGGVDRIGGSGVDRLVSVVKATTNRDPIVRQQLMRLLTEERIREWTNQRVRAQVKAGRSPGPESSIGKVHQGGLNQRIQLLATDLLGAHAMAWETDAGDYGDSLPFEIKGMLRSRANTIEGGTTEVNKNIVGERVLGLPREPDPWHGVPWREVPRS